MADHRAPQGPSAVGTGTVLLGRGCRQQKRPQRGWLQGRWPQPRCLAALQQCAAWPAAWVCPMSGVLHGPRPHWSPQGPAREHVRAATAGLRPLPSAWMRACRLHLAGHLAQQGSERGTSTAPCAAVVASARTATLLASPQRRCEKTCPACVRTRAGPTGGVCKSAARAMMPFHSPLAQAVSSLLGQPCLLLQVPPIRSWHPHD